MGSTTSASPLAEQGLLLDRRLGLAGPQKGSWMAHTPSRLAGPEQRVLEGDLAEIRLERWGCKHHLIYFLFEEKEDAENPFSALLFLSVLPVVSL